MSSRNILQVRFFWQTQLCTIRSLSAEQFIPSHPFLYLLWIFSKALFESFYSLALILPLSTQCHFPFAHKHEWRRKEISGSASECSALIESTGHSTIGSSARNSSDVYPRNKPDSRLLLLCQLFFLNILHQDSLNFPIVEWNSYLSWENT